MITTTIPLSHEAMILLQRGIDQLDAGNFKFPASVRYGFARASVEIKAVIDVWKTVNTALFEAHGPIATKDASGAEGRQIPAANQAAYNKEVADLLAMMANPVLPRIPVADLRVGDGEKENAIPISVLAVLSPILIWPEG